VRLWDTQTGQPKAVLRGHTGAVSSVAFSPDGRTLASASFDKTVRLWDTQTREVITTLKGHTREVKAVAFSPDGRTLASASFDKTVRLCDARTGQFKTALQGDTYLWSVAFSPDGSTLAAGSGGDRDQQGGVRLWDVKTGQVKGGVPDNLTTVYSVAFSPDGSTLATGSGGQEDTPRAVFVGAVRLWDVKTGRARASLQGHPTEPVHSVAFSPDGQTLAIGAEDRMLLWDVKTGQLKATLQGDTDGASAVAFSPDGLTLASSGGKTVQLWDVTTEDSRATLPVQTGWVTSVAFSPDGSTLATGSGESDESGAVRLWDVKTGQLKATFQEDRSTVSAVAFSPDGQTIATGSGVYRQSGVVRLWDVKTGQPKATLQVQTGWVTSVAFSPDGLTLASGSGGVWDEKVKRDVSGEVRLWDVKTGEHKATLQGDALHCVAFSPDGSTLATGSAGQEYTRRVDNGEVRLWDVKTGQIRDTIPDTCGPVAFSPDGSTLAGISRNNTVRLWDVKTGQTKATLQVKATLQLRTTLLTSVAFSPDGQTLASGFSDDTVRLWDVRTGQPEAILSGHTGRVVNAVAFSPDGLTLASGSGNNYPGQVRLWDLRTGQAVVTLQGHTSTVYSVAFSPDGLTLASASDDFTMRLWDVKTGQTRATLKGDTYRVTSVAFSADGLTLASAGHNTVRLWDVRTGQAKGGPLRHTGQVDSVAFSPDGQRVVGWDLDGRPFAWTVADGQPADPGNPPLGSRSGTVVTSPDGLLRAEARGLDIVLIDTTRDRQDRAERLALEPVNRAWWHQKNATRAQEDRNWFAAAFHFRQLRCDSPEDPDLIWRHEEALLALGRWEVIAAHLAEVRRFSANPRLAFQLAVAQVSVGDEAGYRRTCQDLLSRSAREADPALAACLAGTVPQNVGSLALAACLTADPAPLDDLRLTTIRACLLKPDEPAVLEKLLPLTARVHPLRRGAVLCRLKRYDEAAALLEPVQQFPLAPLYLALAEIGRGNLPQARQALALALARRANGPLSGWESQQEFELLRREVAALSTPRLDTPPRVDKVSPP
jgi:WD40 repeat protein